MIKQQSIIKKRLRLILRVKIHIRLLKKPKLPSSTSKNNAPNTHTELPTQLITEWRLMQILQILVAIQIVKRQAMRVIVLHISKVMSARFSIET